MTDSDYKLDQAERARRRAAWDLLKQSRNPEYVSLRFGYTVQQMRDALAKIPADSNCKPVRSPSAKIAHSAIKRASELVPETLRRSRIPGEDDDAGEVDSD